MARILVIDDNDLVRASTRSILESEGYVVDEAGDGDIGIARVKSYGPDLILTDIVMPNKEGIEMIRDLRGRGYQGPIIAMSGGGASMRQRFSILPASLAPMPASPSHSRRQSYWPR